MGRLLYILMSELCQRAISMWFESLFPHFTQQYDLSQLHRGLDSHPSVFCTDVLPTGQTLPLYRLRPQVDEEIGNFIEDVSEVKFYMLRQ